MADAEKEHRLSNAIAATMKEEKNRRESRKKDKKSNADDGITDAVTLKVAGRKDSLGSLNSLEAPKPGMAGRQKSSSREDYLKRIDTIMSDVKMNQARLKSDKKKELLSGPAVIWYLAKRYHAVQDLSWSEYIRHFLPYPLITLCASTIQVVVLILLRLDTEAGEDADTSTTEDIRLVQARLMALIILAAYILMTGMFVQVLSIHLVLILI